MKTTTFLPPLLFILMAFSPNPPSFSEGPGAAPQAGKCGEQLNITLFLDLSNRITKEYGYGPQPSIDTSVVMSVVDLFRNDAKEKGTYCAKGMLRFRADPPNVALDASIKRTETDFSKLSIQKRGEQWASLRANWSRSISDVYQKANENANSGSGSDIGGFLRDLDQYITQDHRNILVILTDGEVYQNTYQGTKNGKGGVGNITAKTLERHFKRMKPPPFSP